LVKKNLWDKFKPTSSPLEKLSWQKKVLGKSTPTTYPLSPLENVVFKSLFVNEKEIVAAPGDTKPSDATPTKSKNKFLTFSVITISVKHTQITFLNKNIYLPHLHT
jgi:hypothetical protein